MRKLSYFIKRNENPFIFIWSTILFTVTYLYFDFYYGWIDDVIQMNMLRGTYNDAQIWDYYFHHCFLSYLYAYLYKLWPNAPWYGLFMYSYLFAVTVLFLKIIRVHLRRIGVHHVFLFFGLSTLLFTTLLMESIVLLIYSKVAILLSGMSLMSIILVIQTRNSPVRHYSAKLGILGVLFILGFLTRPEVCGPIIFLAFLFLLFPPIQITKSRKIKLVLFILIVVGVYNVLNRFIIHSPDDPAFKWEQYQINLSNAQNFKEDPNLNKKEKIKYLAIRNFYFYDRQQFTAEFMKKVGGGNPLLAIFTQDLYTQLENEINMSISKYPAEYLSYYNYFWKVKLLFGINLSLLLLSIFFARGRLLFIQLAFFFIFLLILLVIGALIKMEERFFTPFAIFFTFINLSYTVGNYRYMSSYKEKNWIPVTTLFLLIIPAWINANKLTQVRNEFQQELTKKAMITQELKNNYQDMYIFLGIPSMGLLHQKPLEPIDWSNYHLYTFGEYWANFLEPYQRSFQKFCGTTEYDEFYRCLLKREDVVFLHGSLRISMLEAYYDILYDMPLSFHEVNKNSALSKIEYSYIHEPIGFGYYKLSKRSSPPK